jgi:hypothetical protein
MRWYGGLGLDGDRGRFGMVDHRHRPGGKAIEEHCILDERLAGLARRADDRRRPAFGTCSHHGDCSVSAFTVHLM